MKKYINLFKQQAKQKKSIIILKKLHSSGYIAVLVLIVLLALEWGGFYYLQNTLSTKEKLKNRYVGFIQQNKQLDTKISKFIFKYDLLKQSITKDANIYFYYDLLTTLLSNISTTGNISAFSIKGDKEVTFTLEFNTYDSAISFLSQMESGAFIEYFDMLELKDFSIDVNGSDNYNLQFTGIFKKLTNAT